MKLLVRTLIAVGIFAGILVAALIGFGVFAFSRVAIAGKQGPQQLATELRLLRSDGVPTTPAELQRPAPPAATNAAPDFKALTALLVKKPLIAEEESEVEDLGQNGRSTLAQDTAVSRLLKRRSDIMNLVYRAARKPQCVFIRDWSQGPNLSLPEYSAMREAVRLLRDRAYLLAKSGRYHDAIETDALCFRVANDGGQDPDISAYLVDTACDEMALSGLDHILRLSGVNAAVADEVRNTIAHDRPSIDLRRALGGEINMAIVMRRMIRDHGLGVLAEEAGGAPSTPLGAFEDGGKLNGLVDAMLAVTLNYERQMIETTALPVARQTSAFDRIDATFEQQIDSRTASLDPKLLLAAVLVPQIDTCNQAQLRAHTQERVVMAGAAVLAYRARHKSYPDRLDQAASNLPPDPFTQRPLLYRREPQGFVVYSAGLTGHFDGRPPRLRNNREVYFLYPA